MVGPGGLGLSGGEPLGLGWTQPGNVGALAQFYTTGGYPGGCPDSSPMYTQYEGGAACAYQPWTGGGLGAGEQPSRPASAASHGSCGDAGTIRRHLFQANVPPDA